MDNPKPAVPRTTPPISTKDNPNPDTAPPLNPVIHPKDGEPTGPVEPPFRMPTREKRRFL